MASSAPANIVGGPDGSQHDPAQMEKLNLEGSFMLLRDEGTAGFLMGQGEEQRGYDAGAAAGEMHRQQDSSSQPHVMPHVGGPFNAARPASNPGSNHSSGNIYQSQDQQQQQHHGAPNEHPGQVVRHLSLPSLRNQANPIFMLQQEAHNRSSSNTSTMSQQQPRGHSSLIQLPSALSTGSAPLSSPSISAPLCSQWAPTASNLCSASSISPNNPSLIPPPNPLPSDTSAADATCSSSLYVKNLPPEASELLLYQHFAPHGAILSCKVLTDPDTGRCRGVGFVNYVDSTSAVRASQLVHGTRIAEGRQVHVTLQAPRAVRTAVAAASALPQQQQQQQQQQGAAPSQASPQLTSTLLGLAQPHTPFQPLEGNLHPPAGSGGLSRGGSRHGAAAFSHVTRSASTNNGSVLPGMHGQGGFDLSQFSGQQEPTSAQLTPMSSYFQPASHLTYSFMNIPEDSSLPSMHPNSCPALNLHPETSDPFASLHHLSGPQSLQGSFRGTPSLSLQSSGSNPIHSGLLRPIQRPSSSLKPQRSSSIHGQQSLDTSPLAHGALGMGSMLGDTGHDHSLAAFSALSFNPNRATHQQHPHLY